MVVSRYALDFFVTPRLVGRICRSRACGHSSPAGGRARGRSTPDVSPALPFVSERLLKNRLVESQVRHHLLQLPILVAKLPEFSQLADAHLAVLALPAVNRGLREAAPSRAVIPVVQPPVSAERGPHASARSRSLRTHGRIVSALPPDRGKPRWRRCRLGRAG
jgi:hypothetical protein